jgi:hypothetical protein
LGSEVVAFQISGQPAFSIDDHGVEGMEQESFIRIRGGMGDAIWIRGIRALLDIVD